MARQQVVGNCIDDPDGAYPFRGLTWPEHIEFYMEYDGIEPTVGSMIDSLAPWRHRITRPRGAGRVIAAS